MSSESARGPAQRYVYQLPTRLDVEDQLIVMGPFSLTLRQSFVLIVTACVVANVWRSCAWLGMWHEIGLALRVMLAILPLLLGLLWTFLRLADRYLEEWTLILGRYLLLTKHTRWVSICQRTDLHRQKVAAQYRKNGHNIDEEENIL